MGAAVDLVRLNNHKLLLQFLEGLCKTLRLSLATSFRLKTRRSEVNLEL